MKVIPRTADHGVHTELPTGVSRHREDREPAGLSSAGQLYISAALPIKAAAVLNESYISFITKFWVEAAVVLWDHRVQCDAWIELEEDGTRESQANHGCCQDQAQQA